MNSKELIRILEDNRERRLRGEFISIPFGMKSLDERAYGIHKGTYYIITAASGVGKTQLTKHIFVYNVLRFAHINNIPIQIYYFALEESEKEFKLGSALMLLNSKHNISIDYKEVQSLGTSILSQEILNILKKEMDTLDLLHTNIKIIDNCYTPEEIMSTLSDHLLAEGELKPIVSNGETTYKYFPNRVGKFNIVITDHIGLLSGEGRIADRIDRWSKEYCLKILTKQYDCSIINIQQQSAEKIKSQYTITGKPIVEKLIPSQDGLADNKSTFRDAQVVLGVFDPSIYHIETMSGYNVAQCGGNLRTIHIVKNRFGSLGAVATAFNGAAYQFTELPAANEMNSEIYKQIRNKTYGTS